MRHSLRGTVLRDARQVVCMLRLLVLAGLAMIGLRRPPGQPFLYWFLVATYGATILGYLWARTRDYALRRTKWLIFAFDVAMVSTLIILRGHEISGFLTAYFGLVLMAAIVEGLGNAFFNALLVSVLYGVLANRGTGWARLLDPEALSNFAFFFITALFMGHVATEARRESRTRREAQDRLAEQTSELQRSTEALRAAREALRASDRLATLGMLSAGLAHEIRTPLAAIRSSLEPAEEILRELSAEIRSGGTGERPLAEATEILRDCRAACDHLSRVATDLTALAREGVAPPQPVDAAATLDTAARMLRRRTNDRVRLRLEVGTSRPLLADPGRLLQVLLNLGGNALDALEERGHGTLLLGLRDAGERVVLHVEDDGPGIPASVQERIFQPFFTTKPPGHGTGLGLHVVSEIVKAYRGTIQFDSQPGGGTRFRVEFPAAAPPPEERIDDRAQEDAADRGRRGAHPQGTLPDAAQGALSAPARA